MPRDRRDDLQALQELLGHVLATSNLLPETDVPDLSVDRVPGGTRVTVTITNDFIGKLGEEAQSSLRLLPEDD